MTSVIDRRDISGKSTTSRQRFRNRIKRHIADAVRKAVRDGSITDIGKDGVDVPIPRRDTEEPAIRHGEGGTVRGIGHGNKEYVAGDRLKKPPDGEGKGKGDKAGNQKGEEFYVHISQEEVLDYLFEDLALPNLVHKALGSADEKVLTRHGFASSGPMSRLDLAQSWKRRLGRLSATEMPYKRKIIALLREEKDILTKYAPASGAGRGDSASQEWMSGKKQIAKLEGEIVSLKQSFALAALADGDAGRVAEIDGEVETLKKRSRAIPRWNESADLRYRYHELKPKPTTNAVMLCIMDRSGSMDDVKKYLAKMFFILLHRFLKRHYKKVEVVFISHDTEAQEVDEDSFFHKGSSGGTFVSSGLEKAMEVVRERYPLDKWNIYGAQSSDGDNFDSDNAATVKALEDMMGMVQAFFYTEIKPLGSRYYESSLLNLYEKVRSRFEDRFWMGTIERKEDVYPLFQRFFKKRGLEESGPRTATSAPGLR